MTKAETNTSFVFVHDGHLGPVEEAHQVLVGGVERVLRRVQVDGQLVAAGARLQVEPRLQVRDVQRVADRLHVRTEERVRRPEDRLHPEVDLAARYSKSDNFISKFEFRPFIRDETAKSRSNTRPPQHSNAFSRKVNIRNGLVPLFLSFAVRMICKVSASAADEDI